jgi:hypothetical protein
VVHHYAGGPSVVMLSKTWNQIDCRTEGRTDLGMANERERNADSGDIGRCCTVGSLADDSPDTRAWGGVGGCCNARIER